MNKMEIPIEKNKEYVVDIVDNGFEGEGIAKVNDYIIFIPGAIKGEKVKILIVKVLTSYGFGKILEVINKSESRAEPDCDTYKRCGGCNLRHIKYGETLKMKQNIVQNLVNKNLKQKVKVYETEGMENPYHYRNKLQYPVGIDKNGKAVMGVFANRSHEIIPISKCKIQNEESENIAKYILDLWQEKNLSIYNEKEQKGLLRHIVIKVGIKTNEIMCILVVKEKNIPYEKDIIESLTSKFSNIKTIVKNINPENTNVILGKENIILYGDGFIEDKLGNYTFKISPLSFYQVNPVQTEKLYNLAIKGAKMSKEDTVFDLYCGIGTISIFASKYVKKVYGIEIVEEAVKMAKENAKINSIQNAEFLVGDTEVILDNLINVKKIFPDIVIVDPPRKGLDNLSINNIIKIKPRRLVYISCNPATLVRDLKLLEDFFEITSIKPVDMFPFTSHVEVIALLCLK